MKKIGKRRLSDSEKLPSQSRTGVQQQKTSLVAHMHEQFFVAKKYAYN